MSEQTAEAQYLPFLRLRQLIDAKRERRAELVAAIAEIDAELAEAHEMLNSLQPVAPPKGPSKYFSDVALKRCARCALEFTMPKKRKYCDKCGPLVRLERIQHTKRLRAVS